MAKGFNIESSIGMSPTDLTKLTEAELRQIAKPLIDAANKRIRRLRERDMIDKSDAFMGLEEQGLIDEETGTIRMPRSMTREQVLKRLLSTRNFMGYQTSSISGVRTLEQRIGEEFPTEYQETKFWKAYHQALSSHSVSALKQRLGIRNSDQIVVMMKAIYEGGRKNRRLDDIVAEMNEALDDVYKKGDDENNDPIEELTERGQAVPLGDREKM